MHTKDKIRYRNFLGIGDTYAIITLNQAPNIPSSTIVQSKSMQTQYRSENSFRNVALNRLPNMYVCVCMLNGSVGSIGK